MSSLSRLRRTQLLSLIVSGFAAVLLLSLVQAHAPTRLMAGVLGIHLLRVLALSAIAARRRGYPLSNGGLVEIVWLDLLGAAIAAAAIVALSFGSAAGPWLAGAVIVETLVDMVVIVRRRLEPITVAPTGPFWLGPGFPRAHDNRQFAGSWLASHNKGWRLIGCDRPKRTRENPSHRQRIHATNSTGDGRRFLVTGIVMMEAGGT
ncbi:hypothetical protein [Bradyrhizobium prioriisuperbiae]|uniref:hypothetical protein n=1 Tax=Bradyrhizobium prioriisuperbiae TaxID=2854389 RepID=UPI0028E26DA4|nr:hypothetical protein [Bradyrhizobium prioritasuperba]